MSPETNLGENIHHSGKFIDFDCCERRCLGTAISFGEGLIVLWMHLPKKRRPTEFLEHILNSGSCRKIDLALRISEARPKSKIYENPDFLQFLASRKVPLKVRSTDLLEYMLDNGSIDGIRAVIAAGLYSNASIMAELTARPTATLPFSSLNL
ncbi:hypothetical protein BJ742DRAFT_797495 [Cladochytrium replicatum]|nr:hypothetical protein BJ742DRAFT_797495 [Cladochytrium replicatum]